MPFGEWFDDYYSGIYVPAIEAAGLKPHRADDHYRPSAIVHDICGYTKKPAVILADLTGKNPNVFYELGLAHAIAKPAVLVSASIEDVPFDLRSLRVITYDKNAPDWGAVLGDRITAALEETLRSPIESVLPSFLDVRSSTEKPSVTAEAKEVLQLRQELDVLRPRGAYHAGA